MKKYKGAVYIGRFQPPHKAHIQTVEKALELAEKAVIIAGDYKSARSVKNPFTFDERKEMLLGCLKKEDSERVIFCPVRNFPNDDSLWTVSIKKEVSAHIRENLCITGHVKDSSSYYLKLFPEWEFESIDLISDLNATDIRNIFFQKKDFFNDKKITESLHSSVVSFLKEFALTESFSILQEDWFHLAEYKASWKAAPYPPVFVTADCAVLKSGHILLVKRKSSPGKGLFAVPGGFLDQNETLLDCAIRELKEETEIDLSPSELKDRVSVSKVFDRPDRSLRGRTVTHTFLIDLGKGDLPSVKGSDDAEKAFWMPITEIESSSEFFFEDHLSILENLIFNI
ncbi:MAG TPA: bifunctional nicotinamide-nucleotide adenylyltransferase/Nudix hydroxylase [Leptospiraceae bacterium]|nr:bifunctional nicotinamide-nucleotide adenylyltransferase/Nudix hydroxylase [Leptospiraceae bacterium]HMY68985.1 bifunctional nicotinamide-nucleotide adenylyltransferase/Nudix hydroxylase [Leptospiraceae bacterium]HNF16073.1 bifunctional nicotinamide-nucleotide adenylyltransferase/Nudix hydroxylase [Leptospiraceae bacterium]HNF28388.1 bifunctional nicotinamide-nucleotide adenylyltransferase/Nudix hydroxylase [Leptospiraceae bacterium]HNI97388.1 bifunctional nicotinamide-nucleotide adenylyltra